MVWPTRGHGLTGDASARFDTSCLGMPFGHLCGVGLGKHGSALLEAWGIGQGGGKPIVLGACLSSVSAVSIVSILSVLSVAAGRCGSVPWCR